MNKESAITNFWSGFGLTVYEENTVPSGENAPAFPYITFELNTGAFGGKVPLTASLWYREDTWVNINAKADDIANAISRGGVFIPYDNGAVWLTRDDVFAQRMGDPSDDTVKRIVLNLSAEFIEN